MQKIIIIIIYANYAILLCNNTFVVTQKTVHKSGIEEAISLCLCLFHAQMKP